MGDGHHVWTAAEWVLMVRNCFVREKGDRLILCAGIAERWLQEGSPVLFGPAPTCFGPVSITLKPLSDTNIEIVLQRGACGAPRAGQKKKGEGLR